MCHIISFDSNTVTTEIACIPYIYVKLLPVLINNDKLMGSHQGNEFEAPERGRNVHDIQKAIQADIK